MDFDEDPEYELTDSQENAYDEDMGTNFFEFGFFRYSHSFIHGKASLMTLGKRSALLEEDYNHKN